MPSIPSSASSGSLDSLLVITKDAEPIRVEISKPRMAIEGCYVDNVEADVSNRKKFAIFLGIPYAKPPTAKEKRFAPPEQFEYDPETHGNPFKATKLSKMAPQLDVAGNFLFEVEKTDEDKDKPAGEKSEVDEALDCLYLNVYVPKKPSEISEPGLAVMVYFHGGGFYLGCGNYDKRTPEFMMMQDVVLVTVNYRLGPFGFLNMHSEKCKGNAGLKDQVMALRWVQNNIEAFGGDPTNVTIWGESAGGSCVNFHLISPLSKGLFHKAIIMSGGLHCPWGYTGDQTKTKKKYEKYSSYLERTERMIVDKLMEADATDILLFHWQLSHKDRTACDVSVDIGPSREKFVVDASIPYEVEQLLKDADPIPILAGIARQDGYTILQLGVPFDHPVDWIWDDKSFKQFLKANSHWEEETVKNYFDELRDEYFGKVEKRKEKVTKDIIGPGFHGQVARGMMAAGIGASWSQPDVRKGDTLSPAEENRIFHAQECLAEFCTDLWFHRFYDNFKLGGGLKPPAEMFICEFDMMTELNPSRLYRDQNREITGAAHGDELAYLIPTLEQRIFCQPYDENQRQKITTMCSLWASFSKHGHPKSTCHDVNWKSHTEDEPCYLRIADDLEMKKGRLNERRWSMLNALKNMDDGLKAQKPDFIKPNPASSVRTTLENLIKACSSVTLEPLEESASSLPEIHKKGEGGSHPWESCPDALDVAGHSKGKSMLDSPLSDSAKRLSPSKSPTSFDVAGLSKGKSVLDSPLSDSAKRLSPSKSPTSFDVAGLSKGKSVLDSPLSDSAKRLSPSKSPTSVEVAEHSKGRSTLETPSSDSAKRHSPSKSPTSKSKTSEDESSKAKRGREDDGSSPHLPFKSTSV